MATYTHEYAVSGAVDTSADSFVLGPTATINGRLLVAVMVEVVVYSGGPVWVAPSGVAAAAGNGSVYVDTLLPVEIPWSPSISAIAVSGTSQVNMRIISWSE